ncbi:MAG TPA: hypothetical protein VII56_02895 [Rhizomicrobium sp.]
MSDKPDPTTGKTQGREPPNPPLPTSHSSPDSHQHHQLSAHKGYETAKHLAKRLRQVALELSVSDWLMVFFTAVIAAATVWSAVVVRGQQVIMQGQLDEMRNEQRAWVYADIDPNASLVINGWDGVVPLQIVLHNVGKSPATQILTFAHLYPISGSGPNVSVRDYPSLCYAKTYSEMGSHIFPGQSIPATRSLSQAETGSWDVTPVYPGTVTFQIRGCILYKSGADPTPHHTWINASIINANGWPMFAIAKGDRTNTPIRLEFTLVKAEVDD